VTSQIHFVSENTRDCTGPNPSQSDSQGRNRNTCFQTPDMHGLSLCPDPPHVQRGLGVLSNISCHMQMTRGQSWISDRQSDCRRVNYICTMQVLRSEQNWKLVLQPVFICPNRLAVTLSFRICKWGSVVHICIDFKVPETPSFRFENATMTFFT